MLPVLVSMMIEPPAAPVVLPEPVIEPPLKIPFSPPVIAPWLVSAVIVGDVLTAMPLMPPAIVALVSFSTVPTVPPK